MWQGLDTAESFKAINNINGLLLTANDISLYRRTS